MIYNIIKDIESERKRLEKFPTFAPFREIAKRTGKPDSEIKAELKQLVIEKKIAFGRTINDFYFYICEN